MKKLLFALFTLISLISFCQEKYISSSGYTFKVGDTLNLGQPLTISSDY